jgi:hypothetical protein
LTAPFSSASGKIAGSIVSAVYQESGGTLDFMWQISNSSTCTTPACDPIIRETDSNFTGFTVNAGTRADGSNTSAVTGLGASDPFVDGSVLPSTADRNATGDTIGWAFPLPAQINPGTGCTAPPNTANSCTSLVMFAVTSATNFKAGNAFAIDGGVSQVASFAPAAPVPEPATFALLGFGLLAAAGMRRIFKAR